MYNDNEKSSTNMTILGRPRRRWEDNIKILEK
jgi:hypothetical protein